MNKTSHGVFAPVFHCGFSFSFFWLLQRGSLGSSYIYHISHVLKLLVHKPRDKHKAFPFFIQTRTLSLALVFMKSPQCSNALNICNVLVYRKHADILNLVIDFDNKLEDLCIHLLMLNINALEICALLTRVKIQSRVQKNNSLPD